MVRIWGWEFGTSKPFGHIRTFPDLRSMFFKVPNRSTCVTPRAPQRNTQLPTAVQLVFLSTCQFPLTQRPGTCLTFTPSCIFIPGFFCKFPTQHSPSVSLIPSFSPCFFFFQKLGPKKSSQNPKKIIVLPHVSPRFAPCFSAVHLFRPAPTKAPSCRDDRCSSLSWGSCCSARGKSCWWTGRELENALRHHDPDANHGAGRFTYIETPRITQLCR